MSFATQTKEELIAIPVKNTCCRRAMLYGLLLGAVVTDTEIVFKTDADAVAEFSVKLIHEVFGKDAIRSVEKYAGRTWHKVSFDSKRARAYLQAPGSLPPREAAGFRCGACGQHFLRGAFLSMGTLSDPHQSYHAEFLLPDPAAAEVLDEFLAESGNPARRIARGNRIGLYYKNSASIEELFGCMGAAPIVFELVNIKIERDIRNNENRATNCVAKNISKSVEASMRQIAAIEKLRERGALDSLPEDLRQTARLRYENDSVSLAELAALHVPPISKSGLNHRLEKLVEAAEKIDKT